MSDIDTSAMRADQPVEPESPDEFTQPRTVRSWTAGALGAALSLSLGEFIARFSESLESLVTGVGNLLVELTPGDVVATSINNIGAWQKPILIFGIVFGALATGGWLAVRQVASGGLAVPVGFTLFGLVGGFASARGDLTSAGGSWAVALICAAAGAVATLTLLRFSRRPADANPEVIATPGAPLSQNTDRRRFLAFGGMAAGTVALTAASRVGRTSAAERARDELITQQSASTTTAAPGASAITESTVVGSTPTPLPVGDFDNLPGIASRITPISPEDEFYLIDTALVKPKVDPANWSLTINGPYVDTPVTYTYDELLAREMVTREVTLSCVSNPIGGDLVGNAVWEGIPLSELLEEAGVHDPTNNQHQFFSRSVDGFTCGFPLPLAYDGRTAMLALRMNGEPLPIDHGFPARLVIAGLYGYVSATKWVEEITITDWDGVDGYWMPRGWSKEGPIKTMSRIDVPQNRAQVAAGTTALGGIAWSPTIGIDKVELYIGDDFDESQNDDSAWVEAELAHTETDETWVQWRYEWDAAPGDYLVRVRATDKTGFTQSPRPVQPAPDGAEGWHSIAVRVA